MAQSSDGQTGAFRVAFDLTDEDLREVYARYFHAAYKVDGQGLPRARRRGLWLGAASLLLALVAGLVGLAGGREVPGALMVFAACGLIVLLAALNNGRHTRERQAALALERTLQSCVLDALVGRWTVELTDEGVRAEYAAELRLIKWPGVWGFHSGDGFVSVISIDSRSIIIPLRAFAEPRADHAAAFVRRGEGMLAAAGHGFRTRLTAYLAEHDVLCKGCGYNLRGGEGDAERGPRCPECGRMIGPEDVPGAFRRGGS